MSGIASMDLSKAFDSVSHNLLLQKLSALGFADSSIGWIKSYLTDRSQQVKFKHHISEVTRVEAGVPQGSVLGPILFIAFTADMAEQLKGCKIRAYADDTQILVDGKDSTEVKFKLEAAISTAQNWFRCNSLQINPSKTEILIVKNKGKSIENPKINVEENGRLIPITPSSSIKILGVIVDEYLDWKQHIRLVKGRATNIVRNLARTSKLLPQRSRRLLYDALVCPHLSYADVVWDGCLKQQQQELQRTHNFAARVIAGVDRRSPSANVLKQLGMVPLAEKRTIHQAVLMHKLVNGRGPKDLCDQMKDVRADNKEQRNLRSTANLYIKPRQHRTSKFKT